MTKPGRVTSRTRSLLPPRADIPLMDAQGLMRREWYEFFQVAGQRLGVTSDRIAAAETTAQTAAAAAAAVQAGAASTPYTLTPANPLTTTLVDATFYRCDVQAHTRTEGGVPTSIPAGAVTGLARGYAYTIYYDTPGAYLASSGVVDFTVPGRKLVGTVFEALPVGGGAGDGGGSLPF